MESAATVKDALVAIAAAITAIVAVIGLSNWNRELRGKAAFDVARSLARAMYKLRDEIRDCRSPFISGSEFPESTGSQLSQRSSREDANALSHVYRNRWKYVADALEAFDTCTLEAEAMWGANIRSKTDAFRQCLRELRVAIDAVIDDKAQSGENFKTDRDFAKDMRGKVSSSSGTDNPLTQRIDSSIEGIENELRPYLRRA